ncbi:MAG TPA: hypothetical protein QGH16_01690, partial [Verrucomicrobiota bacterium]|nr:hypothetical protein [Verrucomicrobiota bacterium]
MTFPTLDWVELPFGYSNASLSMNITVAASKITKGQNAYYIADDSAVPGSKPLEAPNLYLYRGHTYTMNLTGYNVSDHPIYLATTDSSAWASGARNDEYTSGVTITGGVMQFVVPSDAPDELYYHCANHSGMGGRIKIHNSGEVLVLQNVTAAAKYSCEVQSQGAGWNPMGEENLTLASERIGRVTGKSQNADGVFIEGWLEVFTESWEWVDVWEYGGIFFDNKAGTFSVDLPPGRYKMFLHPDDNSYAEVYYDGAMDFETANVVTVTHDRLTSDIDFILSTQDTGTISGSLSDATTSQAITSDAELQVFKVDSVTGSTNNSPDYHIWLGDSEINQSTGEYSVSLPAGDYIVRAKVWSATDDNGDSLSYDSVYYGDTTDKNSATTVTVTSQSTTSDIHITISRATYATITGMITGESDQVLSGWAYIDVFTATAGVKISEDNKYDYYADVSEMIYDDATGQFTLRIAPGDYYLGVGGESNGVNYLQQYYTPKGAVYDIKRAKAVAVTANQTVIHDFKLNPEINIKEDYAINNPNADLGTLSGIVTLDTDGDGVTDAAEVVAGTDPYSAAGAQGGSTSGNNATGQHVQQVDYGFVEIEVYSADYYIEGKPMALARVDYQSGQYSISMPVGNYKVRAKSFDSTYYSTFLGQAVDWSGSQAITIATGQTFTADFTLGPAPTGTVTGSFADAGDAGAEIGWPEVTFHEIDDEEMVYWGGELKRTWDPFTKLQSNNYEISAPVGSYKMKVQFGDGSYQAIYWDTNGGTTSFDNAGTLTITKDGVLQNINFIFQAAPTGVITGTVVDRDTSLFGKGWFSIVLRPADEEWGESRHLEPVLGAGNTYTVKAPEGSWKVAAESWPEYAESYYTGAVSDSSQNWSEGATVSVQAGQTLSDVNFRLSFQASKSFDYGGSG